MIDQPSLIAGQPDPDEHKPHVRSPVDLLRLIVATVLVIGGVVTANALDSTFLGLSEDGNSTLDALPDWARRLPADLVAVAMIVGVATTFMWALGTRRYRRLTHLGLGLGGAIALSLLLGEVVLSIVDSDVRAAISAADGTGISRELFGETRPGDPLLAGAVAMLGLASAWLTNETAKRIAVVIGLYSAISILASGIPALNVVADVGAGLLVASALLLVVGRHDLAPTRFELACALSSVGVDLVELEHLNVDARGSAPWRGVQADGTAVFVKALGRDERSADLMFRAYRWLRLRKTGDHRPFVSLQRAVEHEALVSLQARALGIKTPRIIGVTDAGTDGMVIAYEAIDGRSADRFDDIADDALVKIWTMVSLLHARRIAHRDLRLANIFVDTDGEPWLIDFGFSEFAASDQLLGTDVAELLASTTAKVGHERAVAGAHEATGLHELERALKWLQPLALSSATRGAVGGKAGIEPIRRMLIEQCMIPEEELVRLERVNPKALFIVATLALSGWFLLPQLADIDDIWSQVKAASLGWALLAVVLSLGTYAAATASLLGAIPVRVPFVPALAAQMASSFANRVTPARVGGLATNVRYFQKRDIPTVVSVSAVGLNAVAGLIVHVSLTVLFLLLAGDDTGSEGLPVPSPATVSVAFAIAAAIVALSVVIPAIRHLLAERVLPQLRTGWNSIREVGQSGGRLAALFGGSAAITLFYLFTMVASLNAFGSDASFPLVALLFLTGSAVANAAPTPGGLGAAEAALIAALSLAEDPNLVIPAVFLYRFVTFWLPILPGWLALNYLRRTDQI